MESSHQWFQITSSPGLKVDNQLPDITFVNKIIKKLLGLVTVRQLVRKGQERYWVYRLDSNSLSSLARYHSYKLGQLQTHSVKHLSSQKSE